MTIVTKTPLQRAVGVKNTQWKHSIDIVLCDTFAGYLVHLPARLLPRSTLGVKGEGVVDEDGTWRAFVYLE